MAQLLLENLSDELYEHLRHLADRRRRSVSAEAVRLLEQAVGREVEDARRTLPEVLAELRRHRYTPRPGTPDSVELLREERER